jgi:hypothetical protein
MAAHLDARFRLFPTEGEWTEMAHFDFQAVSDPSKHAITKPQGDGRSFYELPNGDACYFIDTDEVYLNLSDGVRALCKPLSGCATLSTVELEPKNLFVASHFVFTVLLIEILKRRSWYSLHAAGFSENGRAILIPGTSGAGKSTLSVALLRAKFDYLSDDMLFLRRRPDGLVVRGFVEDVDVSDQTIRFFPELGNSIGPARAAARNDGAIVLEPSANLPGQCADRSLGTACCPLSRSSSRGPAPCRRTCAYTGSART